jgi:hypothetical protein
LLAVRGAGGKIPFGFGQSIFGFVPLSDWIFSGIVGQDL